MLHHQALIRFTVLLTALSVISVQAETRKTSPQAEALKAKYRIEEIAVDESGFPTSITGDLGAATTYGNLRDDVYSFLVENAKSFGLKDPFSELLKTKYTLTKPDLEDIVFQQYHRGFPVQGAEFVAHYRAKHLVGINCNLIPNLHLDIVPRIGSTTAKEKACENLGLPIEQCSYDETSLCVYRSSNGTVYFAWMLKVSGKGVWRYYINAYDGAVIEKKTLLRQ